MKREEWFKRYGEYLRSAEWKALREKVLRRDGYMCRACGDKPAVHVHHSSYKYGAHTPMFLLYSVCQECHDTITAVDRGELPAWTWDHPGAYVDVMSMEVEW